MHIDLPITTFKDSRGEFLKLFNSLNIKQSFITSSMPNVFRGFHHYAFVNKSDRYLYVLNGQLTDILFDLRLSSYQENVDKNLSSRHLVSGDFVKLPYYCSHGFHTSTGCTLLYLFEKSHISDLDTGISLKSFSSLSSYFTSNISDKDLSLPLLNRDLLFRD